MYSPENTNEPETENGNKSNTTVNNNNESSSHIDRSVREYQAASQAVSNFYENDYDYEKEQMREELEYLRQEIKDMGYFASNYANRIDVLCDIADRILNGTDKLVGLGDVNPSERGHVTIYTPNSRYYGKCLKYHIENSIRKSFVVSNAFPDKFFDLDRCFVVNRLNIDGTDKQLYAKIKQKIAPCSVVLIMAGVYSTYSKWIDKEIEISKNEFAY